jgi:hypothetical protein
MPSKKKPRPSFEVPEEIGSRQESGWVYRSGTSEVETPSQPGHYAANHSQANHSQTNHSEAHHSEAHHSEAHHGNPGIGAASAHVLTLAIATIAQTVVLVVTIAVTPMTWGMQALQALTKSGDAR